MLTNVFRIESCNRETFENDFVLKGSPVVLSGLVKTWPACRKWNFRWFAEHFGDVEIPLSNYEKAPWQKISAMKHSKISDVVRYIENVEAGEFTETSLYAAGGWNYKNTCESLLEDMPTPDLFRDNLINKVPKSLGFNSSQLFLAHRFNRSPLHTDSFFVSVWLSAILGTKVIRLVSPLSGSIVKNGLKVFDSENVSLLDENGIDVLEATIQPGDVLYIPPGWWHEVCNAEASIAVSNHFVHQFTFLPFEQQVRSKIMPLLKELDKLKTEVLQKMPRTEEGNLLFDPISLSASSYLRNEELLLDYVEQEIKKTRFCLSKIEREQ